MKFKHSLAYAIRHYFVFLVLNCFLAGFASNAFLTLFVIGSIGGASLVLTATYLMLGGKQADPMVLGLGLAAVVLMLAGLGRAAFRAGFGFMDDVMDAKQDEPRK